MTPERAKSIVESIYKLIESGDYELDTEFTAHTLALLDLSIIDGRTQTSRLILSHYGVPENLSLKEGIALLRLLPGDTNASNC